MAITGTLQIQASVTGGPAGSRTIGPYAITTAAGVDQEQTLALVSGNNTVTIPAGVTCMVIWPPNAVNPQPNPTYGGTLTLKGASGDTGVVLSNKFAQVLSWDLAGSTAPASIVINASVASGAIITVWFM